MASPVKSTPQEQYANACVTFSARVPAPPTSGNEIDDARSVSNIGLPRTVLKGCLDDHDAILPVNNAFMEYQRRKLSQYQPNVSPSEQFQKMGAVLSCDELFMINKLVEHSDLQQADLSVILKSPQHFDELLEGAFQLPPLLKMLPALQIKAVMSRFLDARGDAFGRPLSDFKERGGYAGGKLSWKFGMYTPCFD